jgi:type II secretory pathway component PulK
VVLVLVLVILMGLSSLVISQLKRSSEGVLATASLPPEYETGFRAEAALQIVQEMLRRDRDQYADTRAEPWLEPLELDGLSIRISPCNARINLNAIDEQRTEDAVSRLLPATDNAQRVAALKCWVNPELLKQLPLFRRPNYDDTDPHYVSRGGELQTPGELRLVDGFHDVDPEWVRSRFTVWSENKLNLNFASREAITAYLPELAPFLDEIMNRAKVQGFTHISQLLDVTGMSPGGDDYQQVIQHATVSSHLFRAVVVARAGGCVLTKRYILQRNPLRLDEPPQLVRQDNLSVTLTGF